MSRARLLLHACALIAQRRVRPTALLPLITTLDVPNPFGMYNICVFDT